MKRMLLNLSAAILFVGTACGHQPVISQATIVHTVEITERVEPRELYVAPGQEVQWINHSAKPVRLGFLSMDLLDELACEKGIKTFFGNVRDLITIPSGGSVSLCFGRLGKLQYNVWFDAENPRGLISPTATVYVLKS